MLEPIRILEQANSFSTKLTYPGQGKTGDFNKAASDARNGGAASGGGSAGGTGGTDGGVFAASGKAGSGEPVAPAGAAIAAEAAGGAEGSGVSGGDAAASRPVLQQSASKAIAAFQNADTDKLAKVLLGGGKHSQKEVTAVSDALGKFQADPASLRPSEIRQAEIGDIHDPANEAADVLPFNAEGAWDPASNTALVAYDVVAKGGDYLDGVVAEEIVGSPLAYKIAADTGVDITGDGGARIAAYLGGASVKDAISSEEADRSSPYLSDTISARVNGKEVSGLHAITIKSLILRGTFIENGATVQLRRKSDKNNGNAFSITDGHYPDFTSGSNRNYTVGDTSHLEGEIGIRNDNLFGGSSLIVTVDNPTMPDLEFEVFEDKPKKTALTGTGQNDNSQNASWVQKKHISFDPNGPYFATPGSSELGQIVTTRATDQGVNFLRNYGSVYSAIDNLSNGDFVGGAQQNDPKFWARVSRAKDGTFTETDKNLFMVNRHQSALVNNGLV